MHWLCFMHVNLQIYAQRLDRHTLWIDLCVLVYVLLSYTHSYRKCVLYDHLNWEGLFHSFYCVVSCCHPVCFSLTHSSTHFSQSVLCLYVCVCTNQRHCSCTVALLTAPVLESPAVNVSVISHVIPPYCSVQNTEVQRNICKFQVKSCVCVLSFTYIDSIQLPDTRLKHLCGGLRLHCVS